MTKHTWKPHSWNVIQRSRSRDEAQGHVIPATSMGPVGKFMLRWKNACAKSICCDRRYKLLWVALLHDIRWYMSVAHYDSQYIAEWYLKKLGMWLFRHMYGKCRHIWIWCSFEDIRVVYRRLWICWSAFRYKKLLDHQMMSPLPIYQKFDNCFWLKRERIWNICMEAKRVVYGGKVLRMWVGLWSIKVTYRPWWKGANDACWIMINEVSAFKHRVCNYGNVTDSSMSWKGRNICHGKADILMWSNLGLS